MKALLLAFTVLLSGCSLNVDINEAWDNIKYELGQDFTFGNKNKNASIPKDFIIKKPQRSRASFKGFYEFFDPEYEISIKHIPRWNDNNELLFDITSFDYDSARKIIIRSEHKSLILTDDHDRDIKFDAFNVDSLDLKHSSRLKIVFRNTDTEYINVYFQAPDFYTKTPFVMSVPNPSSIRKPKAEH